MDSATRERMSVLGPREEAYRNARALGMRRGLVVDDEEDARNLVCLSLSAASFEALPVETVDEALDILRVEPIDFVVSDVNMVGLDGHSLVRALRACPEWAALPVIAVSGYANPEERARALRSGFDAHLSKPFDATVLMQTIVQLLHPAR